MCPQVPYVLGTIGQGEDIPTHPLLLGNIWALIGTKSPCRSGCSWDFPHNKDIGKLFSTHSGWQGGIHGLSKLKIKSMYLRQVSLLSLTITIF